MAAIRSRLSGSLRYFSTPAATASKSTSAQRLQKLREKLDDGPDFGQFASGINARKEGGGTRREGEPEKPSWLRIDTPTGARRENFDRLQSTVKKLNLATVCEEAKCPNIGECWGGKEGTATATIMLMGDTCTRGCSFCNVKTSRTPPPLDPAEPKRVAEAIVSWGLSYVVLTSVDRDDLADQGSGHLSACVEHLKASKPSLLVECLTPDFRGDHECIDRVARSGLDVFAHNVETVERLQSRVRDHRANFKQSLSVLQRAKETVPTMITKTSIMLGLGETAEDLRSSLRVIRDAGVDVVTFGQYLRPSKRHIALDRYVTPEEFEAWKAEATAMGFLYVASGPLVRSSYKAGEYFLEAAIKARRAGAAVPPSMQQAAASAAQA